MRGAKSLIQAAMSMQGYRWVQLLLQRLSGAFDPTAEGQAAIADADALVSETCRPGRVGESQQCEDASSSMVQRGAP